MASFSTRELKAATAKVVQLAADNGTLGDLTPRLVRRKVESELDIDAEVLEDNEYKHVIKDAITDAVAQYGDAGEVAEGTNGGYLEQKTTGNSKKRKSGEGSKPKSASSKTKEVAKKGDAKGGTKATGKVGKSVRSASVVLSSDEEEGSQPKPASKPKPTNKAKPQPKTTKKSVKKTAETHASEVEGTPPKKRRKKTVASDNEHESEKLIVSQHEEAADPPILAGDNAGASSSKEVEGGDQKSESELSVLIDDAPKPKRKKKGTTAATTSKSQRSNTESKKRKGKESPEVLSKDDQEIKRLKGFVIACGIRKVWAREFKDMDKPDQIRKLKQLLADLGMKGRLSLEQAKAIKEKRELAQELQDVQEFEKAVVSGPSGRASRSKAKKEVQPPAVDSDDEMSDIPPKLKNAARKNIMAFLEDQSDEE